MKKKPQGAASSQRGNSPGRKRSFPALAASIAVCSVLIITIGLGKWRRTATRLTPGACRGCNVLLITIDTLRVDRVGAFGGRPGLTPNLDRLAARGLRLTHAY